MAACPSCQQHVDDDFGMVTCPHCGHVFLIDFQGEVDSSQNESFLSEPASGEDVLYSLHGDDEVADVGSPVEGQEDEGFDPPLDAGDEAFLKHQAETAEDPEPYNFESILKEPAQVETKSFAEEISEFAESPGLPEGPYQYRLKIRTYEAQDILQNLRQVLKDLGLEESSLTKMDAETLALDWLGAIPAYRLVRRLRSLGVNVEWDQRHALREMD
jgi:hypothetical protein